SVASSALMLIALAALAGSVSALALGNALSLLAFAYPPARRSLALAIWGVGLIVFYAAGPILGGVTSQYLSWRFAFVVLSALAAVATGAALWGAKSAPGPAPRG